MGNISLTFKLLILNYKPGIQLSMYFDIYCISVILLFLLYSACCCHSFRKADVMNVLESAGFSRSNPYYIVKQGKVRQKCALYVCNPYDVPLKLSADYDCLFYLLFTVY